MATEITLEQVEHLAAQLPVREQWELFTHLSELLQTPAGPETENDPRARAYFAGMESFLRLCEESPVESKEGDAADDIRQLREERLEHL
jgi:hypothetical protein